MIYDEISSVLTDYNNQNIEEQNSYIIFLGGIGDFLSLDYIYNFSENNNIIFITAQSLKLKDLLKSNDNIFKKKYYALYFNFKIINQPGFTDLNQVRKYFSSLNNIKIVSIDEYFLKIKENEQELKNTIIRKGFSKIISNTLIENIKQRFSLPNNIVFISPYTEDIRIDCIKCNQMHYSNKKCILTRNFVKLDYYNTSVFLKNRNLIGVIISTQNINIPDHMKHLFINLSTRTTLLEAIEILKICEYYVGIDSLFSVIASKLFPKNRIFIKCNNKNGLDNKDIYFFPQKNMNIRRFI